MAICIIQSAGNTLNQDELDTPTDRRADERNSRTPQTAPTERLPGLTGGPSVAFSLSGPTQTALFSALPKRTLENKKVVAEWLNEHTDPAVAPASQPRSPGPG